MLQVNDKLEILEAIARYNKAADERDVEATVALYTTDGFIEGDFSTAKGHEGLRQDLPQIFAMEGTLKRHISTNHFFEESADTAVVHSVLIVLEGESFPGVGATAIIRDEFRKEEGRWKVASHRVTIDPAMFHAMNSKPQHS